MDSLSDVREWPENALPIASNWNCGGFSFDWHVDQIRSGNWLLATTKVGIFPKNPTVGAGQRLSSENESFFRDGGFPLTLRTENIPDCFLVSTSRLPAESMVESPLVWSTSSSGTLEDESVVDMLGPLEPWRQLGEQWGQVAILVDLQNRFPNASCLVLADNNETGVDKPTRYLVGVENRDYYPDKIYSWPTPDVLGVLSVRVRDYAATGKSPLEFLREFELRRSQKYNALKSALNTSIGPWSGRLILESYDVPAFNNAWLDVSDQYSPQFNHSEAGGGTLYVPKERLGDFTSPEWFRVYLANPVHERAESLNPKHIRQTFVNFSGGGIVAGYQAGRHEVMTKERICAHYTWLLWSSKGTRTPFNLRYWVGNGATPATALFSGSTIKQMLIDAGYADLAAATEEMPIRAAMDAVNRINSTSILRKFWLEGTPVSTGTHPANELRYFHYNKVRTYPKTGDIDDGFRLLDCDANTPRSGWLKSPLTNSRGGWSPNVSIKVWGTATELNGDYLLHVWTPCKIPIECNLTLPNGWRVPVILDKPEMYLLLRRQSGFTTEVIQ